MTNLAGVDLSGPAASSNPGSKGEKRGGRSHVWGGGDAPPQTGRRPSEGGAGRELEAGAGGSPRPSHLQRSTEVMLRLRDGQIHEEDHAGGLPVGWKATQPGEGSALDWCPNRDYATAMEGESQEDADDCGPRGRQGARLGEATMDMESQSEGALITLRDGVARRVVIRVFG